MPAFRQRAGIVFARDQSGVRDVDLETDLEPTVREADDLGVRPVPSGLHVHHRAVIGCERARLDVPRPNTQDERLRAIGDEGDDRSRIEADHWLLGRCHHHHDWYREERNEHLAVVKVPVDVVDRATDAPKVDEVCSEWRVSRRQRLTGRANDAPVRTECLLGQSLRPNDDARRRCDSFAGHQSLPPPGTCLGGVILSPTGRRSLRLVPDTACMTAATGRATPFPDLEAFVCGPVRTNVYVLVDPHTRDAAVIDPAPESTEAINRCLAFRRATLRMVVVTHRHFDHVGEAGPLAATHGAPIAAHESDVTYLASPQRPRFFPGYVNPAAPVTNPLADGDEIVLAGASFTVLHTPGHSSGAICLHHQSSGTLFSGDTLFAGTFGRHDLPDSNVAHLRASLLRLSMLPSATRVLPGHGRETTIASEAWLADPPIE